MTTQQITLLLDTILQQNYFSFMGQFFQPNKGLAMGSPISGTMAEIFLQQFEDNVIKHLLDEKIIAFYTRYVDDIFMIYDNTCTNPEDIMHYVNSLHNNIQLSPIVETNNSINFLDLTITRNPPFLKLGICQKPTATDTTINFLSNHSHEQKMAAYRFLIRSMFSLPLDTQQRHDKWQRIRQVAHKNNIPPSPTLPAKTPHQTQTLSPQNPSSPILGKPAPTKWSVSTFSTPLIRKITNLFKRTNVRVSFSCTNTLFQCPKPTNLPPPPP
jgi:hypothetical protein